MATRPTRPRSSPLSLFDYGKTGNERGESIVEEECCDTCDYPVLFTRRDLAAILLEHNKLQGRVAHFRSNASPYNTMYVRLIMGVVRNFTALFFENMIFP